MTFSLGADTANNNANKNLLSHCNIDLGQQMRRRKLSPRNEGERRVGFSANLFPRSLTIKDSEKNDDRNWNAQ
jgi:hypothetical protein